MAQFLRDTKPSNLSIDETTLRQLHASFIDRFNSLNSHVPPAELESLQRPLLHYVIRFDNKGYRVFTIEELLRYFHEAHVVERIVMTVETVEAFKSTRNVGAYVELHLDALDPNRCVLHVSSDDRDWVDASYANLTDILSKAKKGYGWLRGQWAQFGIQIIGLTLGYLLSLWISRALAPRVNIENAFVLTFFFVLLVFSNIWTQVNQRIVWLVNFSFPNVKFRRPEKDKLHWLVEKLVAATLFAVVVLVLTKVSSFFLDMIVSFLNH